MTVADEPPQDVLADESAAAGDEDLHPTPIAIK